jgi:hypothetical protein
MELFEILDKRFAPYAIPIALLEKLHTGLRWAEGPAILLTSNVSCLAMCPITECCASTSKRCR